MREGQNPIPPTLWKLPQTHQCSCTMMECNADSRRHDARPRLGARGEGPSGSGSPGGPGRRLRGERGRRRCQEVGSPLGALPVPSGSQPCSFCLAPTAQRARPSAAAGLFTFSPTCGPFQHRGLRTAPRPPLHAAASLPGSRFSNSPPVWGLRLQHTSRRPPKLPAQEPLKALPYQSLSFSAARRGLRSASSRSLLGAAPFAPSPALPAQDCAGDDGRSLWPPSPWESQEGVRPRTHFSMKDEDGIPPLPHWQLHTVVLDHRSRSWEEPKPPCLGQVSRQPLGFQAFMTDNPHGKKLHKSQLTRTSLRTWSSWHFLLANRLFTEDIIFTRLKFIEFTQYLKGEMNCILFTEDVKN
uniref:uncharacterized protein LOC118147204 n=1 Tax=Callithrix jacchus TaxID=9483 RepID=UPI0023DD2AEE|nr:uncharacterized protein LOC118147204 [Callithrix jacchus]